MITNIVQYIGDKVTVIQIALLLTSWMPYALFGLLVGLLVGCLFFVCFFVCFLLLFSKIKIMLEFAVLCSFTMASTNVLQITCYECGRNFYKDKDLVSGLCIIW